MTTKQYYDLLVKSASDGTFPSIVDGTCKYRGKEGKKCAVGILMSDNFYKPGYDDYENPAIADLIREFPETKKLVPKGMKVNDLAAVQNAHDDIAVKGWKANEFVERINGLECFKECVNV